MLSKKGTKMGLWSRVSKSQESKALSNHITTEYSDKNQARSRYSNTLKAILMGFLRASTLQYLLTGRLAREKRTRCSALNGTLEQSIKILILNPKVVGLTG